MLNYASKCRWFDVAYDAYVNYGRKEKNSFFAALQLNAKMFIEKIALDKYANGKHPSRAPLLSRTHSLTPSFDNNKSNELTKCTNEFLRNVFL